MESLVLSGRQSALQQEVPLHKMATSSEPCHKMAASPEPVHKVGPRLLRLASSLADLPLRSVRAAAISRLLTSPVVLEDSNSGVPGGPGSGGP